MKVLILSVLFLTAPSILYAGEIQHYNAFNPSTPEVYTGSKFELNEFGVCELVKRKQFYENKVAQETNRDQVDLINCRPIIISNLIVEELDRSCTQNSKTIIKTGGTDFTFLQRDTEVLEVNKLNSDCLCENIKRSRTWLANVENIFLNPLNSLFNGPTTKSNTIHSSLDITECSELATNEDELRAIQNAYEFTAD